MTIEEKLSGIEGELIQQTGCRAEEIAGLYRSQISKPVVNTRMGNALRRIFTVEDKCSELAERIAELEAENARLRAELNAIQNRHPLQAAEDAINALRNL